jgi:hypothetical protein
VLIINLAIYIMLTPNLIVFFFWPRHSELKSSFKLRKGHFFTVQFYENLPSPIECHSPGLKQLCIRTSGSIGKSFWKLALVDLIYHHKCENMQSWKKWPLCGHVLLFKRREPYEVGWGWTTKISTMKTNGIMALEFQLPTVLKRWSVSIQFHFKHHTTKDLFLKIKKGLRDKKKIKRISKQLNDHPHLCLMNFNHISFIQFQFFWSMIISNSLTSKTNLSKFTGTPCWDAMPLSLWSKSHCHPVQWLLI